MGSAVVGLLVGLTGMGGGALMTPMLVLLFGVTPSAAIASDLMAAFFMKPAGVVIHWRRKTVNTSVVRYLCYGSVPAAFFGTYVTHLLGQSAVAEHRLQILLGTALIIGAVLAQSLPLTFSAALGTLLFGHVQLGLTSSIVIGSVPAVIVGSLLSSRSNGYLLRRVITGVVLLSGLKYVGVPTDWLGVIGGLEIVLITFLTGGRWLRPPAPPATSVP